MCAEEQPPPDLVSIVSHDLQNPLNVAQIRLELAQQECDCEHLSEIEAAHERMETLIQDLLLLTRKASLIIEVEEMSLSEIAENCWRNIPTEDASLVVESNTQIQGDQLRFSQLLENLFRNAVEHGGHDVTVSVGESDAGFYVADDGTGITENDRDQIFKIGYSTSADGTGLGLSIVQKVIDVHDWDLTVETSETGGTRFEVITKDGIATPTLGKRSVHFES